MTNLTVGADPELFIVDHSSKLISAIDKFGGTKDKPKPMQVGDGFGVLEDNVMVEFNIPPATSSNKFVEHIQLALGEIESQIKNMGFNMSNRASGDFSPDELADHRAWVFGCEPDFCAYTGEENTRPSAEDAPYFRTCGGHVHVGCGELNFDDICKAVAFMDLYLGVPSMRLDTDTKRRSRYGKAGAFRRKPYGFEYRTLSNFWIFNPDLVTWVYHATEKAIEHFRSGYDLSPAYADIQAAINNNDKEAQARLISHFKLV